MEVTHCETFDFFENLMKEKAERAGEEFLSESNVYTSENLWRRHVLKGI